MSLRRPSSRLPPPLADAAARGIERESDGAQTTHYFEHGSSSRLVRWHYHELYELHLIVATHGRVTIGDYRGRFEPYSLVLLGPNLPHNWVSDPEFAATPLRDRVLQFSEAFVQRYVAGLPGFAPIRALLKQARCGLEFSPGLGEALEPLLVRLGAAQGMRRLACFLELLVLLSEDGERRVLSQHPFRIEAFEHGAAHQIEQAVRYIQGSYARPISLGGMAEHYGMNHSAFSRLFQRHTGYRFVDYLNQLRIRHACECLVQSDLPIIEVCFTVGYSNLSNFNRRFLSLVGLTPREYRRRNK